MQKSFLLLLLVLMTLSNLCRADDGDPRVNDIFISGHNLTATSDVLKKGQCALGIEISACGLTNRFSLGTSTWMIWGYEMASLALRGQLSDPEEKNKWAFQVNYFKTYRGRRLMTYTYQDGATSTLYAGYEMQALWLVLIRTIEIEKKLRLHFNLDANYYINDTMPFSLRRPTHDRQPTQFNASMLAEIDVIDGWFILWEGGLLDFANNPLHIHFGSSFGKVFGKLSAHAGFSMTTTLQGLFIPATREDYQAELRSGSAQGYGGDLSSTSINRDYAIHPEFSLLYAF